VERACTFWGCPPAINSKAHACQCDAASVACLSAARPGCKSAAASGWHQAPLHTGETWRLWRMPLGPGSLQAARVKAEARRRMPQRCEERTTPRLDLGSLTWARCSQQASGEASASPLAVLRWAQ
jgi:hypothetical protein